MRQCTIAISSTYHSCDTFCSLLCESPNPILNPIQSPQSTHVTLMAGVAIKIIILLRVSIFSAMAVANAFAASPRLAFLLAALLVLLVDVATQTTL
jgi:hypothetical protein